MQGTNDKDSKEAIAINETIKARIQWRFVTVTISLSVFEISCRLQ